MIELLYEESNFAVVKLPGRAFPGVVIQGDSLFVLYSLADELMKSLDPGETRELAMEVAGLLESRLDGYQKIGVSPAILHL
jgi:hypothetical protein